MLQRPLNERNLGNEQFSGGTKCIFDHVFNSYEPFLHNV